MPSVEKRSDRTHRDSGAQARRRNRLGCAAIRQRMRFSGKRSGWGVEPCGHERMKRLYRRGRVEPFPAQISRRAVSLRLDRCRCWRWTRGSTAVHVRLICRHVALHVAIGHRHRSHCRGSRCTRAERERERRKEGEKDPDHAHKDRKQTPSVNERSSANWRAVAVLTAPNCPQPVSGARQNPKMAAFPLPVAEICGCRRSEPLLGASGVA